MQLKQVFIIVCISICLGVNAQSPYQALYHTADSLNKAADYRGALNTYSLIIQKDSTENYAYWKRAFVYSRLKHYDAAIDDIGVVVRRVPEMADCYVMLGWFQLLTRQYDPAIQNALKGIELMPESYEPYLVLAHVYYQLYRNNAASYYFDYAYQLMPSVAEHEEAISDIKIIREAGLSLPEEMETYFNAMFESYKTPDPQRFVELDSLYVLSSAIEKDEIAIQRIKQRFIERESGKTVQRKKVLRDFAETVGKTYYRQRSYSMSQNKYLDMVEDLNESLRDSLRELAFYDDMSLLAFNHERYGESIYYNKNLLATCSKYGIERNIINDVETIAIAYGLQDKVDSCIKWGRYAYTIALSQNKRKSMYAAAKWIMISYIDGKNTEADSITKYKYIALSNAASIKDSIEIQGKFVKYLFEIKKYKDTEAAFKPWWQLVEKGGMQKEYGHILSLMGFVYENMRDNNKAVQYYKTSIEILKNTKDDERTITQNISPVNNYREAIVRLTSIYTKAKDYEQAFMYDQMGASNFLYHAITGNAIPAVPLTLKQVQQQLTSNDAAICYNDLSSTLGSTISFNKTDVISFIVDTNFAYTIAAKTVFQKTVKYFQPYFGGMNFNIQEMKNQIGALPCLAALLGSGRYNAGLARSVLKIKTDTAILGAKDMNDIYKLLYEMYITPFESIIKDKHTLYIQLDNLYKFIPFELMMRSDGKYLAELYNIVYVPSFTINALTKQRPTADIQHQLLVGDANYKSFDQSKLKGEGTELFYTGSKYWSDLPGTALELASIYNVNTKAVRYQKDVLSETRFKQLNDSGILQKAGSIHLAVHGIGMEEDHQNLSLIFTEPHGGDEDGIMRFEEIAQMKLNARMVCISACESGAGMPTEIKEYISMADAFIVAGAGSVIASSWKISDEGTRVFMSEMYKQVYNHNMSFAEALFTTKKNFASGYYGTEYQKPYYWAGFRYFGY